MAFQCHLADVMNRFNNVKYRKMRITVYRLKQNKTTTIGLMYLESELFGYTLV
jgi:hypothetical protein